MIHLWIHPNETQYIQPFGKYSSYCGQTVLLCTPALATSYGFIGYSSSSITSSLRTSRKPQEMKNDDHKDENKDEVKVTDDEDYTFDFYQESKLRVNDLNHYVIEVPHGVKYTPGDLKQLFENGKIVCTYYDDWAKYIPTAVLKRPHFEKCQFEFVFL